MTNFWKHKMRTKSPGEIAGWIILAVIGIAALAILFGYVVMWLWNWLMPELFGLTTINYWQAVGIFILFKFLFGGGCGGGGSKDSSKKSKSDCKKKDKNDFSKWKYYDKFWEEQGDQAYREYVENLTNENGDKPEKDKSEEE
ncbi:hypothetical protein [Galbibacter sp. EGI 63066]|uniref:hypothetical protein n=1 Tax=Galbibacter sp. EGI 63066 TaxID=2993559 RepID=UPI0022491B8A|nr:hypothetical protein [Galbibacter sp. EGI 63066]